MKLDQNEKLIRESRGTYKPNSLDPLEYYGGKWFLTNVRLHFKGNVTNLENIEESILLEKIDSIEARHHDFISAKINLFLNNGEISQILVPKRKEWIHDIFTALKKINEKEGKSWDETKALNVRTLEKPKGWFLNVILRLLFLGACIGVATFIVRRLWHS